MGNYQMREETVFAKGLGPLTELDNRAAKSLGAAICLRAVKDYVYLRRYHKTAADGFNLYELESFFKSDDFSLYSGGLNGPAIWERMERMYRNGELKKLDFLLKKSKNEREKGVEVNVK